jgi:Flp pilus assembly protein TadG
MKARREANQRNFRLEKSLSRASSDERGAAAVEFALVVSIFLMLVLGMFTGGLAWNRKHAMTHGAREAARFGATLPTGKAGVPSAWFDQIIDRAITSAYGELDTGVPGRYVCVAYVGYGSPSGSTFDWTSRKVQSGDGPPVTSSGWCFDDGRGAANLNERRIQVRVQRQTNFDALLISQVVTLSSDAVARFEAVSP